jgi:hypothetical protein
MKKILLIISIYFLTTLNAFAEFSFTFEWGSMKFFNSWHKLREILSVMGM